MSYKSDVIRYHTAAANAGLTYDQAESLRRDAQRLHTWSEHECNGVVQRFDANDGVTDHKGRTLIGTFTAYNIDGPGPIRYSKTPDRETPALARIKAIADSARSEPAEVIYNGDPRGWPITIKWPDGRELCPPCRY